MSTSTTKRLKIGVLSVEFFDVKAGQMGGFGWATKQITQYFNSRPELCVEIVFISATHYLGQGPRPEKLHGTRILWRAGSFRKSLESLRRENFDLLIAIDYQSHYLKTLLALCRTPLILWIRDPWSPEDKTKLDTLRLPHDLTTRPAGLFYYDYRDFRYIWWLAKLTGRHIAFGTTSPPLGEKIPGTFGVRPPHVALWPNIITLAPEATPRAARPLVIFLARLDPVKRPWLAVELARRVHEADFWLLGKNHFEGKPGGWNIGAPENLPKNLRLLGHVGENEKRSALSQAWVLLNTSIHEGLAVSFQEALACEVPLLSTVDMEDIASRFGIFVGAHSGDGFEALPKLEAGLRTLIADNSLRERLGRDGREWVNNRHNADAFYASLRKLAASVGVTLPN